MKVCPSCEGTRVDLWKGTTNDCTVCLGRGEVPEEFLDDGERDALWDEGAEAALHSWAGRASCPYDDGSARASAWWLGFNHEYAKNNS